MDLNEITDKVSELSNWGFEGNTISKTFEFKSFGKAIEFVNHVAQIAEKNQHHPDITIRYDIVKISLTTHDVSGLSEKDFAVASEIDVLTSGVNA